MIKKDEVDIYIKEEYKLVNHNITKIHKVKNGSFVVNARLYNSEWYSTIDINLTNYNKWLRNKKIKRLIK